MNPGNSAKEDMGTEGPKVVTEIPGPLSRTYGTRLHEVECRGITLWESPFQSLDRALGSNVWDGGREPLR